MDEQVYGELITYRTSVNLEIRLASANEHAATSRDISEHCTYA
jgi:hypothetical protein